MAVAGFPGYVLYPRFDLPAVRAEDLRLHSVGPVESTLIDLQLAPRQGDKGAPAACIAYEEAVADAMADPARQPDCAGAELASSRAAT